MTASTILVVLSAGMLAASAASFVYAIRLKRKRRALYRRFYRRPLPIADGLSLLSLFDIMKAGRVLVASAQFFRMFGISEMEVNYLMPLLLYFEGCVYAGDIETEAYYRRDAADPGDARWARSIVNAATQMGILDAALQRELDLLKDYYAAESALMRREVPLTERALVEINLARSHDILFLYRASLNLLGRPVPERLMAAVRPLLAISEIADDLAYVEQDLQSGSFNTLVLLTQLHSPERARQALQDMLGELFDQAYPLLRNVERRQLGQALGFLMYKRYGTPMELGNLFGHVLPRGILLKGLVRVSRSIMAFNIKQLPPVLPLRDQPLDGTRD